MIPKIEDFLSSVGFGGFVCLVVPFSSQLSTFRLGGWFARLLDLTLIYTKT